MRPTYTKSGFNYLPVIDHGTRTEVLYGAPLANGITATKYAALEIRDRINKTLRSLERA
jgi:hypothetical protein